MKHEVDDLEKLEQEKTEEKALREGVALPVSTGPQPEPEGEETTGTVETGEGAAPSGLAGGTETGDGGTGQSSPDNNSQDVDITVNAVPADEDESVDEPVSEGEIAGLTEKIEDLDTKRDPLVPGLTSDQVDTEGQPI